jgi:bifunctional non-homologous end joining protein LigD
VEKVLVDIYRNRPGQTIVAPYSLRANESAAVSYPLSWNGLEEVDDQSALNIQTIPDLLRREGDAWEGMEAYATGLHTERPTQVAAKKVGSSGKSKTPKQLTEYGKKRQFAKTPEPPGKAAQTWKNDFVVHRHHARNVHCDLRLERDGVLWSFAVPRGLPPRPGIKRLAVKVEDHPLDYADFEGRIPKGEYGAGPMWILARGKYEVTKDKKDSVYIRVASKGLDAEFRLINTRGKDWLLERIDEPQIDWTRDSLEPMMAESVAQPPVDPSYLFEVKWDGLRALISLDDGELRIRSRNQKDMTDQFEELVEEAAGFKASTAVFDGEIVCLDEAGRPQFETVLSRLRGGRKVNINKAFCYLFDCLYLDGVCLTGEPLVRRRELLADAVPADSRFRLSQTEERGDELFEAAGNLGLEGIMAKGRDGTYRPGVRSSDWLKIKVSQSVDCLVVGYTQGKGDRAGGIGALHLAEQSGRALRYVGKVGSGFSDAVLAEAADLFEGLISAKKPIRATVADERVTTWLEPKLICEVEYSARTSKGLLRNARLKRLRPDLSDLEE